MVYNLFIDDERYPAGNARDWTIVRSYKDAVMFIGWFGLPAKISFDHDLGPDSKTGYDIAKWIVDYCLDNGLKPDFEYYVHSQNPIGKRNIEGLIDQFKQLTS